MSLDLIPPVLNDIKLKIVMINGRHWCRGKEVCRALQYNRQSAHIIRKHCSAENICKKQDLVKSVAATDLVEWPKDSNKTDLYINVNGLYELLVKSKQPQSTLLAKNVGINVHEHKYISKESDSISIIMDTFDGEEMTRQYQIGNYRIDLYFPSYKLAIECDEFGHQDRDVIYEIKRQKYIEEQLQCKFIRYNPDAKNFAITRVLNKIIKTIYVTQYHMGKEL